MLLLYTWFVINFIDSYPKTPGIIINYCAAPLHKLVISLIGKFFCTVVNLGVALLTNDPYDGYLGRLLYSTGLWLLQAGWANESVRQTGRGTYYMTKLVQRANSSQTESHTSLHLVALATFSLFHSCDKFLINQACLGPD